ncbi:hypothetical protein PS6_004112 [Mucor atramentarius]
MEVPRGFDGIAVVEMMQVDGSGCGWYSTINEDTEMEDAPFVDVEMLDADEGVDVVMEEVEEEDVEMEEVEDFMDVDEMFCQQQQLLLPLPRHFPSSSLQKPSLH